MPLTITNTSNVGDDGNLRLNDAYRVATAVVDGVTYAIVTGYGDAGVTVFRFVNGVLTPTSVFADTAATNLRNPLAVHALTTAGGTFVYIGGQEAGFSAFRLDAAGTLTLVQNVTDTPAISTLSSYGMASFVAGGTTYLLVSGYADNGVTSFRVAVDGTLTPVAALSDSADAAHALSAAAGMELVTSAGVRYLAVASAGENAIQLLRVDGDGTLAFAGNARDNATTFTETIFDVATAEIGGSGYVYAVGVNGGVSGFRIDAAGALVNVINVAGPSGTTAIEATLDVFTADGAQYLAVGSFGAGVRIFRIGADGALTPDQTIVDTPATFLNGVAKPESVTEGGFTYLLVPTGFGEDGISAFRVGTATNAAPVNSVPAAQRGLEDTDLVFSFATGNPITVEDADGGTLSVTLSVTAGQVTLASTAGVTVTAGSSGSASVTVSGTVAAINAALNGLRYRGALNSEASAVLTIRTTDGVLTDIDTVAITLADDGLINGTAGNDDLIGTASADQFVLDGGGNDRAIGGAGDDAFFFGAAFTGGDIVIGGAGTDVIQLRGSTTATLSGVTEVERITLFSEAARGNGAATYALTAVDANVAAGAIMTVLGASLLAGETLVFNGAAELNGRFDMYGGAGDDVLVGGEGNDALVGGAGRDQLFGRGGNDFLVGGGGGDSVRGATCSSTRAWRTARRAPSTGSSISSRGWTAST